MVFCLIAAEDVTCLYRHVRVRFAWRRYDANPDGLDLALAILTVALPFLIVAQAYLLHAVLFVHTPSLVHLAVCTLALCFDDGGRPRELP